MAGIDSYTKLMLHCDGADTSTTFTDSELTPKTMTANGNAQIDTAQSKFGGASGLFDGGGDYLTTPDNADFDFGAEDFTIDFWVRFPSVTFCDFVSKYSGGVGWTLMYSSGASALYWYSNSGGSVVQRSWTPSADTWYHVEVDKTGTSMYMFIDGTQIGTTATVSASIDGAAVALNICSAGGTEGDFNGWLDEIRISKGIARHTSNFTSPTSAYSVDSSSSMMLMGVGA